VAPKFAEVLSSLFREAGFPEGLVQTLPATREMGPAVSEADVDHVVFTGSMEVGRILGRRLGERLISSTLELSGCDVMLVLADADVARAAKAAWFGVAVNHGQTCIAVRRVIIHRSLYSAFVDGLRPLVTASSPMRLGLPSQVSQIEKLVTEARQQGAKLLVERPIASGQRECLPAALIDASPKMRVCHEAAFGPLLAVMPFDTLEEALAMEAECPCALAGSIFSADVELAQKVAGGLRSGHVVINEVLVSTAHPATPFGGRGESGWGVTQGAEGLLEMTVPQAVSVVRTGFRPYYDMVDPSKRAEQERLARSLLEAMHGPGLMGRLRAWWRVLRAMRGGSA
jgi:acyl-CoA reductase-like NAD-dependent aldehyde dehydrogenase